MHQAKHPVLNSVRKMDPLDRFFYYIGEREAIYIRRKSGTPRELWTTDPILATYKFTNVRRAWDRTTVWMVKHWHKPWRNSVTAGMGCAVARFIGHPASLTAIGHPGTNRPWSRYAYASKVTMNQRRKNGEKLFTGAYVISGAGSAPGTPKYRHVFDKYLTPVAKDGILDHTHESARKLHDELIAFPGWGHFMTQEVLCDAMFTHVLGKARDREDYAMPGPGALRGLSRLHELGRSDSGRLRKPSVSDAVEQMLALRDKVNSKRKVLFRATAHDIEFNLCEFDKYERTLWNQSTPKARYVSSTN